jgi:hypothetical protein
MAYQYDDDEEPDSLYWEYLMEYELTKLRRYFLDEMRRLEPKWNEVFDSATAKRDFYLATQNCDSEFLAGDITAWLGKVALGNGVVCSLRERIDESLNYHVILVRAGN